jgi:hypothetical protein
MSEWRSLDSAPIGVDVLVCVGPSAVNGWCRIASRDEDGAWIDPSRPARHFRTVLHSVRGWMPLPKPVPAVQPEKALAEASRAKAVEELQVAMANWKTGTTDELCLLEGIERALRALNAEQGGEE